MSLTSEVRQHVIQQLWGHYLNAALTTQKIIPYLSHPICLDHFAIIDLPCSYSGIGTLNQLFSALQYLPQGRDYLADKQNEFMWLAAADSEDKIALDALPQVVIADFRIDELSLALQKIIKKYTKYIPPFNWQHFHYLCGRVYHNDKQAAKDLTNLILHYFHQRPWPLPTIHDYLTIKEANELLAWVLVFGRCVNHFGIAIHLVEQITDLVQFNQLIEDQLQIPLNQQGGKIKGDITKGIAQSSTKGELTTILLSDGTISINGPFLEFVWRYANQANPVYWKDYFTGFIGTQANYVIESVYHLPSDKNDVGKL